MIEKKVPYGERHNVTVVNSSPTIITVKDDNNEGYILIGHGEILPPRPNDVGVIVFTKGGPTGGYWKWYPTKKCDKDGCSNMAHFKVIFELRVHPRHEPALSSPIVYVCKDHSDVKWEDIYSEEGWRQLCDGFIKIGRQAPVVKHSNLAILPIEP